MKIDGQKASAEGREKEAIAVEDDDPEISYSGGNPYTWPGTSDWRVWKTSEARRVASGGTAVYSDKPGATIQFGFRGEQLSLDFVVGSQESSATILIDGAQTRSVNLTSAVDDTLPGEISPKDITRVILSSLPCGFHSITITNTSPISAQNKTNRLIFDSYSFVIPRKKACTADYSAAKTNQTVEVAQQPPATASTAAHEPRPTDTMRLAGYAVGGAVVLTALMVLFAWLLRRRNRKRHAALAAQRHEPLSEQARTRSKRLSEVIARYQKAMPARRSGSARVRTCESQTYMLPSLEETQSQDCLKPDKNTWYALDESSIRSSLKSGTATPREAAPGERYCCHEQAYAFHGDISSPSMTAQLSPLYSPIPSSSFLPSRRVEFVGAHPASPPPFIGRNEPVRSILLKRPEQRPWTAPDRGHWSPPPPFDKGQGGFASPAAASGPRSTQCATPLRSPCRSAKEASSKALRRPNTASAVEHFTRGREWVEIDRPLSSIIARTDPTRLVDEQASTFRPHDQVSAPNKVDPALQTSGVADNAELISRPTSASESTVSLRPTPTRPPKSRLRSADGETGTTAAPIRLNATWNGYTYNVAEEQSMWRSPPPSEKEIPHQPNASADDGARTAVQDAEEHQASSMGSASNAGDNCREPPTETPGSTPRQRSSQEDLRDCSRIERLLGQLEGQLKAQIRSDHDYEAAAECASISTLYSRASFDECGAVRSESGTVVSDFATFRSDGTAMELIRPKDV
ncbi:hypothetical protein ACQY0O_006641 [Thecaphora frezii]